MSDSASDRYASAHDPLCPYTDRVEDEALRDVPCGICELIAKVREDMLRRCEEAAYVDLLTLEDDMREVFGKGSDAARIVAGYRSAMPGFRQFHKQKAETRLIYCVVCNRVGQRRVEHSCFCASCPPCLCSDDAARQPSAGT